MPLGALRNDAATIARLEGSVGVKLCIGQRALALETIATLDGGGQDHNRRWLRITGRASDLGAFEHALQIGARSLLRPYTLAGEIDAAFRETQGKRTSHFARAGADGKGLTKRHEVSLEVRGHEANFFVPRRGIVMMEADDENANVKWFLRELLADLCAAEGRVGLGAADPQCLSKASAADQKENEGPTDEEKDQKANEDPPDGDLQGKTIAKHLEQLTQAIARLGGGQNPCPASWQPSRGSYRVQVGGVPASFHVMRLNTLRKNGTDDQLLWAYEEAFRKALDWIAEKETQIASASFPSPSPSLDRCSPARPSLTPEPSPRRLERYASDASERDGVSGTLKRLRRRVSSPSRPSGAQ